MLEKFINLLTFPYRAITDEEHGVTTALFVVAIYLLFCSIFLLGSIVLFSDVLIGVYLTAAWTVVWPTWISYIVYGWEFTKYRFFNRGKR